MQSTPYVTFEQTRSYRVPVALLVAATCAAAGTAGVVMERGGARPRSPRPRPRRTSATSKPTRPRDARTRPRGRRARHARPDRPAPGR